MPIAYDTLSQWPIAEATQAYAARDTILYALGLGLGADPVDAAQLSFVYERGLRALPTLGFVVGSPGGWFADPATGITFNRLVNAGVSARFHAPMPPEGQVTGRSRVKALVDKGAGRGALMVTQRQLFDAAGGQHLCDIETTYLLLADGGFGGPPQALPAPTPVPQAAPDACFDFATLPQAALIYRLSGDLNPLHADPQVAARAKFERPILHGLCTLGMVAHRLIFGLCGADPRRLLGIEGRFSAPLYPGETLRVEVWGEGPELALRARSVQRDAVVLDHGRAWIAPAGSPRPG